MIDGLLACLLAEPQPCLDLPSRSGQPATLGLSRSRHPSNIFSLIISIIQGIVAVFARELHMTSKQKAAD
ncbi:hypothetical protein GE21DRAFT_1283857, partial [Neurospora crassa]